MRGRVFGVVAVLGLIVSSAAGVAPAGAASKPGVPGRPAAVSGNHSARVTWAPAAGNGSAVTMYVVTPYLGSHAQPPHMFHTAKTTQVVNALTNGQSYTFTVAAINTVGTGAQSPASAVVKVGIPTAPARITAAAGNGQATVAWVAASGNGTPITAYVVTPFRGSTAQLARVFHSKATVEVVKGLTNGKGYAFRVAAENAFGPGTRSALTGPVAPTSAPAVSAVMNASLHKMILVNAYGQSLYLYVPDGSGTVSRVGPSLGTLWPSVTWSGTPTVGTGLDASKAAVEVQADGTRQLSYHGHLLYTFLYDTSPGMATGDGAGGFYLLSPAGTQT